MKNYPLVEQARQNCRKTIDEVEKFEGEAKKKNAVSMNLGLRIKDKKKMIELLGRSTKDRVKAIASGKGDIPEHPSVKIAELERDCCELEEAKELIAQEIEQVNQQLIGLRRNVNSSRFAIINCQYQAGSDELRKRTREDLKRLWAMADGNMTYDRFLINVFGTFDMAENWGQFKEQCLSEIIGE